LPSHTEEEDPVTDDCRGETFLRIARETLLELFEVPGERHEAEPWLQKKGACFVTLRKGPELRGCIGTILPHRSLIEDLRANTLAAATRDPRFPPLARQELDHTVIHVSLLSPLQSMEFDSEADLLRQLRPEIDGLVLEYGHQRGTFLPAVWRNLPEPRDFLAQLKRKSGLAPDFWSPEIRIRRYTTESWRETS
jgi:AmmeMemoRadiSam system protein A